MLLCGCLSVVCLLLLFVVIGCCVEQNECEHSGRGRTDGLFRGQVSRAGRHHRHAPQKPPPPRGPEKRAQRPRQSETLVFCFFVFCFFFLFFLFFCFFVFFSPLFFCFVLLSLNKALRDELQKLQEPGSYVGEVVRVSLKKEKKRKKKSFFFLFC